MTLMNSIKLMLKKISLNKRARRSICCILDTLISIQRLMIFSRRSSRSGFKLLMSLQYKQARRLNRRRNKNKINSS